MMCDRVNCGLWLLCEKRKRFEGCVVAIDFVLTLEDFFRLPRKVLETMAKGKRENKKRRATTFEQICFQTVKALAGNQFERQNRETGAD